MTGRRLGILTRAGLGLALGAGAVAVSTFQAPAGARGVAPALHSRFHCKWICTPRRFG